MRSSLDGRGATCTRPSETTSRWRYRSKPTWRIDEAAADFWRFVTTDTPPQLTTSGDVQKAFTKPTPDIVDESADDYLYTLLARYESANRMLHDLKATQKELQEQIILRIGSHTGVRCGNLQATYKPTTRKEYVVKAATYRKFAFKSIEEKEK